MKPIIAQLNDELTAAKTAGTFKVAPVLDSPAGAVVTLTDGTEMVNLCANNYLGLANDPAVIAAAHGALDRWGHGTSSVRFICGTLAIHEQLERTVADFLSMPAATTYLSCWNANEAFPAALTRPGDTVISDALNHASIIDACRLCHKQVRRAVYKHSDMADLESKLKEAADSERVIVITDGVFSMEGDLAKLDDIVALTDRYGALVVVDDSHAHGVVGRTGRGTPEHFGVSVDVVTGTFGKALGGGAGGFVAGDRAVIDTLVQKSRPQLFSNALPPVLAAGAMAAINALKDNPQRVGHLRQNADYLRSGLRELGYEVIDSPTAIVPIIVGATADAIAMARAMGDYGVLITGFGYPVVPEGTARLRAQVSAVHTRNHLDKALKAFLELKKHH